jgi:hypothetical protein
VMKTKSSAVRGLRSCWNEDDKTDAKIASVISMQCHLYVSIILTIIYATPEHPVAQIIEAYKPKGRGFNS